MIHRLCTSHSTVSGENHPPPVFVMQEGTQRGDERDRELFYCPEMPCIDSEISTLHDTDLRESTSVDRYLPLCFMLKTCATGGPKPRHHTEKQKNARKCKVSRVNITCACGDSDHTCMMYKEKSIPSFPFDISHLKSTKQLIIDDSERCINQLHTKTGVDIPAHSMVSSLSNSIGYSSLPDLGMYIRAILLRRFYTPALQKHHHKMTNWLRSGAPQQGAFSGAGVGKMVHGWCCAILQDSLLCMKKVNRTPAVPDYGMKPTSVELNACINVLHGTLLSLYPRAAKRPTFAARVVLFGRIHYLLTLDREEQMKFMRGHPNLVKICFMEYTLNFILDYLPCERDLLGSTQSMALFNTVCPTTCDSFRADFIRGGDEDWGDLDRAAAISIERCVRVCKFKIFKVDDPITKFSLPNTSLVRTALDTPCTYGCMSLLKEMCGNTMTEEEIRCAANIQKNIQVFRLPTAVTDKQISTVSQKHGSCYARSFASCHVYVCCACAMSGKGIKTPVRCCSITGQLSCVSCPPGTVVSINMLGGILKVCNTSYYMCPCCTTVKIWQGKNPLPSSTYTTLGFINLGIISLQGTGKTSRHVH